MAGGAMGGGGSEVFNGASADNGQGAYTPTTNGPTFTNFANTPLATNFSESEYLNAYKDVADAVRRGDVKSGMQHYLTYGQSEGRTPGPGAPAGQALDYLNRPFNDQQYLTLNPDVAQAIANRQFTGTGREHYLTSGQSENRAPSAVANRGSSITTPSYYNTNPYAVDYANIFNPTLNAQEYLARNPDVAAAVATGGTTAEQHYRDYGQREGRYAPLTERQVAFAQPTLTPQQQAGYLDEWQQDYSNRARAATQAANQARTATANAQWTNYLNNKAQAEAAAPELINKAVEEKLAGMGYGQNNSNNADLYYGAFKAGGSVPGGLRSLKGRGK